MKEYIQLTQDKDTIGFFIWCVTFYKDSVQELIHREVDKPAIILSDGMGAYVKNGDLIREEKLKT
jgi:hypothetical protein